MTAHEEQELLVRKKKKSVKGASSRKIISEEDKVKKKKKSRETGERKSKKKVSSASSPRPSSSRRLSSKVGNEMKSPVKKKSTKPRASEEDASGERAVHVRKKEGVERSSRRRTPALVEEVSSEEVRLGHPELGNVTRVKRGTLPSSTKKKIGSKSRMGSRRGRKPGSAPKGSGETTTKKGPSLDSLGIGNERNRMNMSDEYSEQMTAFTGNSDLIRSAHMRRTGRYESDSEASSDVYTDGEDGFDSDDFDSEVDFESDSN